MSRSRPWELRDGWWERVEPLIPQRTDKKKAGRHHISGRQMLGAIVTHGDAVECAAARTGGKYDGV